MKKEVEPLLLVPIGFGCLLVNIPLSDLMDRGGLLKILYDMGIANEVFPLLIFVGIGAMIDFGPLLENPKMLLFGAAGQFGIFFTLLLALALGFPQLEAVSIAVIGACDGPTAIYVASQYAPQLLAPISVAAYSYMALVPIIQPPIMRALTTPKERVIKMAPIKRSVSPRPPNSCSRIVVTLVTGLLAPKGLAADGNHHARQLHARVRRGGAADQGLGKRDRQHRDPVSGPGDRRHHGGPRLSQAATLMIFGMGFIAICMDTVAGVVFGKIVCKLTGGKVNPLIGAAGISAFPMAARVVRSGAALRQEEPPADARRRRQHRRPIGSVAAAVMLSVLKGMGLI